MVVFKPNGEEWRIDRELYSHRFESKVKDTYQESPEFREYVDSGNYEEMERFVKAHLFHKPEEYFTLEKLREGYKTDRRLSIWEILDKIFGKIPRFRTKDELVEEEFEKFLVNESIAPELFYEIRDFFKMYITDEEARTRINNKDFSYFAGDPVMTNIMKRIGPEGLKTIPEYIKDNVNFNRFM